MKIAVMVVPTTAASRRKNAANPSTKKSATEEMSIGMILVETGATDMTVAAATRLVLTADVWSKSTRKSVPLVAAPVIAAVKNRQPQ